MNAPANFGDDYYTTSFFPWVSPVFQLFNGQGDVRGRRGPQVGTCSTEIHGHVAHRRILWM